MPPNTVAVAGVITEEEICDALTKHFPNRSFKICASIPTETNSHEIVISKISPTDMNASNLQSLLDQKVKELKDMELTTGKALASIQSFQKQQQALFDEFVLLRQRYDEQKATLISILWVQCGQYHPELRQIPFIEDEETFIENDEQVGNYAVGDALGEGQFATVRTCWRIDGNGDRTEKEDFAIKVIKKDRITSFQSLKRVSNEIEILQKLKSKNVVTVREVMQTSQWLYIVTEKGGSDLFEFFDEHPDGVPEVWAREIIACVLRAVNYCHEQGVCHRDLKPENILLSFDSETHKCIDLKLCDFGLSTQFQPKVLLSDFCGSPGFFAPEMITHGSYYGDKADVWSTGCILLELVLGHERFCDQWMNAYDYEVLQDKERFTSDITQTVAALPAALNFSADLNDFILRFLKLKISERPLMKSLCMHAWVEDIFKGEIKPLKLTSGLQSQSSFESYPSPGRENNEDEETTRSRTNILRKSIEISTKAREKKEGVMNLPPIEPATPSVKTVRKMLRSSREDNGENISPPVLPMESISDDDDLDVSQSSMKSMPKVDSKFDDGVAVATRKSLSARPKSNSKKATNLLISASDGQMTLPKSQKL